MSPLKKWAFDPKNDEIWVKQSRMSHHDIGKGQKSTKASPQFVVRRYKTTPNGPQWCEIMPSFGPKPVQNGPRWFEIVKI